LVVSLIGFAFYYQTASSLTELWLEQQNKSMNTEWKILEKRIENANHQLAELVERDDKNYRVILDSSPLQSSIRDAGTGGSEKIFDPKVQLYPQIYSDYKRIDKLKRQTDIEVQSYDELEKLVNKKIKMWASRPAIQPVDNRQLDRLHLTFGLRLHPLLNIVREHNGLDFTAAKGTPVYATGDGKALKVYTSDTYGKVVYINHGYGYETRYAHLSGFNVIEGQIVKRGQVIAFVGNSGTSVSDHLHYEVLFNDKHINPINFFQRDLNNKEYEKLIQLGSQNSEPLD
jgi:murein DD-endopeptidase MepM/ murein hydrolase activator NlpD